MIKADSWPLFRFGDVEKVRTKSGVTGKTSCVAAIRGSMIPHVEDSLIG